MLGGHRGHLASFDWKSGTLGAEFHVKEAVRDVHWLHNESLFAAAQKRIVYIYDHTGAEIHALEKHIDVSRLEYLPYHFLLVSVGNAGYLKYQVSFSNILIEYFDIENLSQALLIFA